MDDREAATLASREALYNAASGCSARWLTGSQLRRIEPRLSAEAAGGLWTEGNALVNPGPYTQAVAAAAVALGAKVVRAQARGLRERGGRVTGVITESGVLDCDGVVIATGTWCAGPARWLGVPLPLQPVKGEMLLGESPEGVPAGEVTWGGVGLYGSSPTRAWLGGTDDHAGFDSATTASARERILAGVRQLLPGLGPLRVVRQIAGLRPVTADGLPIVGIPDGWENVCVAAGGGRKGMLLGAVLGLASAELLVTGSTKVPIGNCAPDRWRKK